jgi:ribonuclease HI
MSSKPAKNEALQESLDQLLDRLGIEKWDLLLIGDGSGSSWNFECGWGCVSIEHATLARKSWHGAMSAGTVNFAEMMAYLQPLCWYVNREMLRRKKATYQAKVRHIHIITDSQYAKNKGSSKDLLSGRNGALWQVFKQFGAQGMMLHWHWIRRETVALNQFADQLSKTARLNLKGKDLPTRVEEKSFDPSRTIYQFNPCE